MFVRTARVGVQLYTQRKIRLSRYLDDNSDVCLRRRAIGANTPRRYRGTNRAAMSISNRAETLPSAELGQEGMRNRTLTAHRLPAEWWWERPETRSPWGTTTFRTR